MSSALEEYTGIRAQLHAEAMEEYPEARKEDIQLALDALQPKKGESILEVGGGGGFFSTVIAEKIAPGILVTTDPAKDQLEPLLQNKIDNVCTIVAAAESLPVGGPHLGIHTFDAVWTGCSFHHVPDKTLAFSHFSKLLKPGGRVVILDVFVGSTVAKHFDLEVAKYCATGHEVAFLSEEFADTLCSLNGFEKPTFHEQTVHWRFSSKKDLGIFIYKLHAMVKTTPEECYKRAEEMLGVDYQDGLYCLRWPFTVMTAYKSS